MKPNIPIWCHVPSPIVLSRAAPTLKPRAVMTPSAIRQPGAISISTRRCQQGPHREESDDGGRRRIDEHSSCAYQDLTHLPLRFRAASPPLTIRRLSPSPSSVPSARRSRSFATSWILFRFPWPGNGYRAVRRAAMAASCSIRSMSPLSQCAGCRPRARIPGRARANVRS